GRQHGGGGAGRGGRYRRGSGGGAGHGGGRLRRRRRRDGGVGLGLDHQRRWRGGLAAGEPAGRLLGVIRVRRAHGREQRGGQRELERSAVGDGGVVHQLVGSVDVDPFVGVDGARVPELASDVLRRVVERDRALVPVV